MARELSQEAVLDFLWGAGGRAPNAALLRHFQRFLRDPALTEQQRRERREYFKSLVNSLATVRPAAAPGASKDIVLRRRYRDLLDEELPPPEEQREEQEKEPPPPRRDLDRGEAAEKGRPGGRRPGGDAVAGGCAARGRGGPCCECRRARRAAAAAAPPPGPAQPTRSPPPPPAQPPPYRTQPLSSGPRALLPGGPPRSRAPALPSGPAALSPAAPSPTAPSRTQSPPPPPAGPPPYRTLQPPSARPARARARSPPPPPAGSAPFGSLPPQRPGGSPPPPGQPLPPGPGALSPAEPPLSRSLPLLSAPGVLSRSMQALPASSFPSPPLVPGPDVLPFSGLAPSHSRSLQLLYTSPSPPLPRGPRLLTPNGPTQSQALPPYPHRTPPLLSGSGVLPSTRPPLSQSPEPPPARPPPSRSPPQVTSQPSPSQSPQSPPARPPLSQSPAQVPTQPPPSQSLQPSHSRPTPSQSLLPTQGPAGPQATESSPPAPLPVFRSIRCQLALLEVQGIPSPLPEDCRRQLRTVPSKSSPRNVPSRGQSVPLGQREHAWLVAASAGRWARVRGLFLEEPELALQRDFMSGFTVLHWLAKHGDGPGLQELAAAARQAGLALDVDARSGCGYTPLHLAAIHGHQLVIKVLVLQLGCQVQVRDGSGRRPWEYLGSSTSGEIWQLLEAPRGTIMFPTQPLACSVSSDTGSKVSLSTGRAALSACLRPQHSRGAASHQTGSKSD